MISGINIGWLEAIEGDYFFMTIDVESEMFAGPLYDLKRPIIGELERFEDSVMSDEHICTCL